jgi:hypothetical protein
VSTCALIAPPSPPEPVRREGTLDELVAATWQGLRTDHSVACPVCGAEMRPEYAAHARAIGGRCSACGTILR